MPLGGSLCVTYSGLAELQLKRGITTLERVEIAKLKVRMPGALRSLIASLDEHMSPFKRRVAVSRNA